MNQCNEQVSGGRKGSADRRSQIDSEGRRGRLANRFLCDLKCINREGKAQREGSREKNYPIYVRRVDK